jgi:Ca-activated chloride channel family protein
VNVKKLHRIILTILFAFISANTARAESAHALVQEANKLYAKGNFNQAIDKYDQALVENSQALPPKFNKANSYYRLDDLAGAIDLYKEVAAESKDMSLVEKAKYNLGNCHFQKGTKQKDSDLQKAFDELQTSISYWRQVLDMNPENEKAARNIEVARLVIKDIIDQLNKQKEQQQQQQNQQDQQSGQSQQQQPQQGSEQDPNQPQQSEQQNEPNQPEQKQAESEQQKQQPAEQQKQEEQKYAMPDTTADEILDKEQQQRKQRQILDRARYQKVDKDW